ncbi:MAG: hypothetical protein HOE90_13105 [Bacteriovoracaceae bacterium]|jgi:heme/copper-type cytochrome/quinol oxidase subunit 3|nr:hypothetical protein [Bacteriovoracaceae bacterium]
MSTADLELRERAIVPKNMFGLILALCVEVMVFSGLLTSFVVLKYHQVVWPPVDQPRFPVYVTAINTLIIIFSGIAWNRIFKFKDNANRAEAAKFALISVLFMMTFFVVQGVEWFMLFKHGLTLSDGVYGGIFCTIIGFHAVHVVIAIITLLITRNKILNTNIDDVKLFGSDGILNLVRLYLWFVIGVWPCIFAIVYF